MINASSRFKFDACNICYVALVRNFIMECSNTLFIVVLYNQRFSLTNVYKSLLNRVKEEDIYIWDNSVDSDLNSCLCEQKYVYKYSMNNCGVSYPYNEGSRYALNHNYSWIVLLDQDTCFPNTYLSDLNTSIKMHPDIKLFCPIHKLANGLYMSPVKMKWKFTSLSTKCVKGHFDIGKYAVINSGMAIHIDLFRKTGGYNEKVFLDYSDFQFLDKCSRYIEKGYCIDSICLQDFSNDVINNDALMKRFKLFCKSLKGCEFDSFFSYIGYNLVVLRRLFSLIYRSKSFYPIYIYYKYYLKIK